MEHQDGFNSYPNKLARTSSALIIHPRNESTGAAATPVSTFINTPINHDGINSPNIQTNPNERQQVPEQSQCFVREQDQYMPIANVIRIMRRILPPHAKISDDAKETVQECVSEYISFITGEANERCHREQRKTITAEDVIWAMGKLGFDSYVEPLTLFLNRYRESESERTSMPKEPMVRRAAVDYGQFGMPGPGPYGPVYNLGPQQGFYDPSLGAFFRDGPGSGLGGGSSSQPQGGNMHGPGFDPFAQFK